MNHYEVPHMGDLGGEKMGDLGRKKAATRNPVESLRYE